MEQYSNGGASAIAPQRQGILDIGDAARAPAVRNQRTPEPGVSENSVFLQSNELARGTFAGSVHLYRILAVALCKLDRRSRDPQTVVITQGELRELFPSYSKTNALGKLLDEESDSLMALKVVQRYEGASTNRRYPERYFDKLNVVMRSAYNRSGLHISFHPDVMVHLSGLHDEFVLTRLRSVAQLGTSYQFALYMFLRSHAGDPQRSEIQVAYNALRAMLGVDDPKDKKAERKYGAFTDFNRRVLTPAVEKINETTDLSVSFALKRRGREVTDVVFRLKKTNDSAYLTPRELALAGMMHTFGMSKPRAVECLLAQGFEFALQKYVYARIQRDLKVAKKPGAYLHTICSNPDVPTPTNHERFEPTKRQTILELGRATYSALAEDKRSALLEDFLHRVDPNTAQVARAMGVDHHTIRHRFDAFLLSAVTTGPLTQCRA